VAGRAPLKRVRVATTGTLHIGDALSAVASRAFGDWLLLRIGAEAILDDLRWLGVTWDDVARRSERGERYREAARQLGTTVTDELAAVVDDIDFGISHVVDHRPLHAQLYRALGTDPPEYVHHGLILGDATVAFLRDAGIPAEAVRVYLEELGLPRHDVHLDLPRIRRLAIEVIHRLSDEELAERAGAACTPVMRGARDLNEARDYAQQLAEPPAVPVDDAETLARFEELASLEPRELLRELRAAGGDLKALRLALTGRERGPELAEVLAALPREEALRRVHAAYTRPQ
jgi:glutamyl-tRNA synthetase